MVPVEAIRRAWPVPLLRQASICLSNPTFKRSASRWRLSRQRREMVPVRQSSAAEQFCRWHRNACTSQLGGQTTPCQTDGPAGTAAQLGADPHAPAAHPNTSRLSDQVTSHSRSRRGQYQCRAVLHEANTLLPASTGDCMPVQLTEEAHPASVIRHAGSRRVWRGTHRLPASS